MVPIEENKRVLEWAKFENTIMKVSSLPDPKMFPERDAGKVIKDLVNRFTPMRLIYGGGFDDKSDAQSYRAYRENIRSYLAALSPLEQVDDFREAMPRGCLGLKASGLYAGFYLGT